MYSYSAMHLSVSVGVFIYGDGVKLNKTDGR